MTFSSIKLHFRNNFLCVAFKRDRKRQREKERLIETFMDYILILLMHNVYLQGVL